ncbi:MAG: precorrin-2 C(20)-methyltransferase [Clostridiales bacterium]|nr:precorrin-2 C(20)-methyltransferase [Clostridiales bacterium]MCF8022742.1 precorrin-2 C(20)-methyltransferase [Clostridiales bacterium]
MSVGKFYGVGVGPGDPELLTMKARRVLGEISILCVPKSGNEKNSLAFSIASGAVGKEWTVIELLLPMTRDQQKLKEHQLEAARKIDSELQRGQDVAFITLGDPTMYSTFTYLLKFLREINPKVNVEIIPGISSINAVSCWMQVPLAESEEKFAVVPALQPEEDLKRVLEEFDNVMILKAGKQLEKVLKVLDEKGLAGNAAFACKYGLEDGFFTTNMESLRGTRQDYLSAMLVKRNDQGGENK